MKKQLFVWETSGILFITKIALFIAATTLVQWVSYQIMITNRLSDIGQRAAIVGIMPMAFAFGLFTIFFPKYSCLSVST
jgi:hypothetical protein